ncbi:hypothetical protein POPTR_003G061400v4 [Populus trichocarpa]|uniref:Uncharacterized protein n=1 Tax=Populus trichocarpa TaxID=3694 RepID=A0ACC0T7V6_POPTR|nr:hypothetical protein POPTR_003G061400v4 [Populus trichocarpa]
MDTSQVIVMCVLLNFLFFFFMGQFNFLGLVSLLLVSNTVLSLKEFKDCCEFDSLGALNVKLSKLDFGGGKFGNLQQRSGVRVWMGRVQLQYAGVAISHKSRKAFRCCGSASEAEWTTKETTSLGLTSQLIPNSSEKQIIKEGQVLCYIEQLGGELPIESDISGEVIKILREDGEPVGYGDALIAILPSFPGIKKLQ